MIQSNKLILVLSFQWTIYNLAKNLIKTGPRTESRCKCKSKEMWWATARATTPRLAPGQWRLPSPPPSSSRPTQDTDTIAAAAIDSAWWPNFPFLLSVSPTVFREMQIFGYWSEASHDWLVSDFRLRSSKNRTGGIHQSAFPNKFSPAHSPDCVPQDWRPRHCDPLPGV